MNLLSRAISLASTNFEDVTDKGGQPYILHCLTVMNKVSHLGELAMIVGVLHDVLEDTDVSAEDLWVSGFGDDVIDLVKNVTHRDGEEYMDYIKRAASHPISRAVKMADLEHNSQIFRMKGLRQKDFQRLEKYFTAYEYLKG